MIASSLAKIFPDECPVPENIRITTLKGETASFQFVFEAAAGVHTLNISASNDLQIEKFSVEYVPIDTKQGKEDDDFLLKDGEPGFYPDVLVPFDDSFEIKHEGYNSIWIDITSENAGDFEIDLCLDNIINEKAKITVYDCEKPKQTLKYTNWFHCDCLATQYNVPVFSPEHWTLIENYMSMAARHGMNMILTPLFTPPLDTEVGGERPTVQLVDVAKSGNKYTFCFNKLLQWVSLCDKYGIEYLEMSHLFTQWGAKAAPKIMATVDGKYTQLFGWDTKASGIAYRSFMLQFIPAFNGFIKENGLADRVYFHVSDEPGENDMNSYMRAHRMLLPLLNRYKHIDALSRYEYYEKHLVEIPVPGEGSVHDFDRTECEKWVYYCCGPNGDGFINRFIFMPSVRARVLGAVMYRHGQTAFLHWGYNFWYSTGSKKYLDPYTENTAGGDLPAGDGFVVYPGKNMQPYASIRLKQMRDFVGDYEALLLLEKKIGRHNTMELLPHDIDYNKFPQDSHWLLNLRNKVNFELAKK